MDRDQCSLCGGFFHPKHGHFCHLKGDSDDVCFASFLDELKEIAEDLERCRNFPSYTVSDSSTEEDATESSCLLEQELSTCPYPDQNSCSSATPIPTGSFPDVSTYYSFNDFQPIVSDTSAENSANSSGVLVETSGSVIGRTNDNPSEHFSSRIADCSIENSEAHLSVVAPVAAPSANRTQSVRTQEEKRFLCDICGRRFTQRGNLTTHHKRHSGERPFACETCGRRFYQKGHLSGHMRTHTKEKPFECEQCGKGFSKSSSLKEHIWMHTEKKPFECTECGNRFTRKATLKRHLKIHARAKEEPNKFLCDVCGRGFSQKGYLQTHYKRHSRERRFACETCGRRFYQKCNLVAHMRTHTKEKPFECEQCGRRFSQSSSLTKHLRTHTGEKPFQCNECGWKFRQKAHLQGHLEIHTRKHEEPHQ